MEYSSTNERIRNIWSNREIYYSYEACEATDQDDSKYFESYLYFIGKYLLC